MIATILTLFCLFCIYVGSDNSTLVWIMIGVIVLAWLGHIVVKDSIRAEMNRDDYWAKSEKERVRERIRAEEEVREEEAQKRRDVAERQRRREEKATAKQKTQAAHVTETQMPVQTEPEHKKAPAIPCERCGHEVRIIRTTTYQSGKTYVEYQCPYCSERKLKKVG